MYRIMYKEKKEEKKEEEKNIPNESWKHKTRAERKAELIFQLYNMFNNK